MARITVLTGGSTPERDVALAGAGQVVPALRSRGHQVSTVDTVSGALSREDESRLLVPSVGRRPPSAAQLAALAERELGPALVSLPEVKRAELVFPVLHGRQGEGGEIQALLEAAGIPYAGSGVVGSALAMDKDVAKRLFLAANVPTADWALWPAGDGVVNSLGLPLVVKPSKVGSTVGLSVVRSLGDLEAAVATALEFDDEVMLERYLTGREFTVGILGMRSLAVGEIVPRHEIFDYECKYTPGMTDEIFPAQISKDLTQRLQELALGAHRALKLRDFSRVDFRLDAEGNPSCLEVNTLPGLTSGSLLPQAAAAVGIDFEELCDTICREALQRLGKVPS